MMRALTAILGAIVATLVVTACATNGVDDSGKSDAGACEEGACAGDEGTSGSAGSDIDHPGDSSGDPGNTGGASGNDGIDTDGGDASVWLHTEGNKIYRQSGEVWHGRGMNIHDTRSCWACSAAEPNVEEVKRRIDEAVDGWGADFLRLCLESYAQQDWMTQWQNPADDPGYLADIKEIVDHVGLKKDVYVMVTLWVDDSFSEQGWPTSETVRIWERLAEVFAHDGHVIFGLVNEPEMNYDGSHDKDVWNAMNDAVAAIRAVESSLSVPHHLVAVQGTGGWARLLDYYTKSPIEAGDGENVVYETHVYNPRAEFDSLFIGPSALIPVIIGEFGPVGDVANMSLDDCGALMDEAERREIPFLAWTFHHNCPPNLIQATSSGCGVGMELVPTEWGRLIRDRLSD